MTVLSIDTCGHACSLALVDQGVPLFHQTRWMARGHAAVLAPLADQALQFGSANQVSGLVVTRGPGGFTGMRAGLAYARAFALARGVPLYTLDVFAALRLSVGDQVPCLIDSRRGDLFYDLPTAQALGLALPDSVGLVSAQIAIASLAGGEVAGSIWQTPAANLLTGPCPQVPGWIEPCLRDGAR